MGIGFGPSESSWQPGRARACPTVQRCRHLTNETIWGLTTLPAHLAVVGGGATGTDTAQAFHRLGSRVTIITDGDRLLTEVHPDAAHLITERLTLEGVTVHTNTRVVSAVEGDDEIRLAIEDGTVIAVSDVLVTTGRDASLRSMNPEAAGIQLDGSGAPLLDDRLRTSQKHIYVCGDAAGAALTHVASAQGAACCRTSSPRERRRSTPA